MRVIAVRLTPKSSSERIGEIRVMPDGEARLIVHVTAPPDKNKANEAMLKLLAKHFKVAPSMLVLLKGQTHRNKLVGIKEEKEYK
jgi:uncharacterized protein (TIGR00251 family)